MAEDELTLDPALGDDGGEADPSQPSLADRLALADDDIPEDLRSAPIADIRAILAERETTAKAEARAEAQAEYARAQAVEREQLAASASVQEDVSYYEDLRARRNSTDETIKETANREFTLNEDRYIRGGAAARELSQTAAQNEVLASHYGPLFAHLKTKGHDGFEVALRTLLPQHENNPLLAAIEYGRTQGEVAGVERGRAEGARQERISQGREAAPDLPAGAPMPTNSYGDPAWVKAQMDRDPEWALTTSSDGKQSNLSRATAAGALKRAQDQMRSTAR